MWVFKDVLKSFLVGALVWIVSILILSLLLWLPRYNIGLWVGGAVFFVFTSIIFGALIRTAWN